MNVPYRYALALALAVAAATFAAPAFPQAVFYEREGFEGRSFTTSWEVRNFQGFGLNSRVSSLEIVGGPWEICDNARFGGRCVILPPGRYGSPAAMGLNERVSSARKVSRDARIEGHHSPGAPQAAQITFYEHERFEGRYFATETRVPDLANWGFNDRASSVDVVGERWEVCDNAGFTGRCVILRPGRYTSLAAMGLNDRISSVRLVGGSVRIEDKRYAPAPRPTAHDVR